MFFATRSSQCLRVLKIALLSRGLLSHDRLSVVIFISNQTDFELFLLWKVCVVTSEVIDLWTAILVQEKVVLFKLHVLFTFKDVYALSSIWAVVIVLDGSFKCSLWRIAQLWLLNWGHELPIFLILFFGNAEAHSHHHVSFWQIIETLTRINACASSVPIFNLFCILWHNLVDSVLLQVPNLALLSTKKVRFNWVLIVRDQIERFCELWEAVSVAVGLLLPWL